MFSDPGRTALLAILLVLSALALIRRLARGRVALDAYVQYLWAFFVVFGIAEFYSFGVAVWVLALLCFIALREYFSLVDIRLQDRWGVLGAFLAIPFMVYFIQIDWYGMFIISIPVYAFLGVPFLIALGGGEPEGTVFSIGAIDFGLFLLVYCIGHIGYLAQQSTWRAALLVLAVAACDLVGRLIPVRGRPGWIRRPLRCMAAVPIAVGLALLLSRWAGVPTLHAVVLGCLIPPLVEVAGFTLAHVEADLGIDEQRLLPGRGQILDSIKSLLYAAPVVFHYCRYYLT